MVKTSLTIIFVSLLAGCSSTPPKWLTGSDHCAQIGCGKDLSFYPMTHGEAERQARAAGWDWGKTSSAYPPSDPKYWELKKQEEAAGQTPWHWNQNPLAK